MGREDWGLKSGRQTSGEAVRVQNRSCEGLHWAIEVRGIGIRRETASKNKGENPIS